MISSFAEISTSGSPIGDTRNTAGALATVSNTNNLSEALTNYGLNKAYVKGLTGLAGDASSQWSLIFTLTGGPAGSVVPVTIDYQYDVTLSALNGGFNLSSEFGLGGKAIGQAAFPPDNLLDIKINSNSAGLFEQCPGLVNPSAGQCLGTHSFSQSIAVNLFVMGQDTIGGNMAISGDNGFVDAFNTGKIVDIILPDGVSWTYESGIAGNPLNFQNAGLTPAVPEPGSLLPMSSVLGGVLLCLKRARMGTRS